MNSMRMDLGQSLQQKQLLSPRMIHSMEVLQLPSILLNERILRELQENPFLEVKEHMGDEKVAKTENADETFNPNKPLTSDADNTLDFQRLERLDRELGGLFEEENRPSRAAREEMSDRKMEAMNNIADREVSLQDHLTEQLHLLDLTPEEYERVEYLVNNLDDRGYLASTLEELALAFGKEATMDQWEEALEKLQDLEPSGIGARDLKESLFLQIAEDTPYADALRVLVRNHLEDISHNRLPQIQKATGYSLDTIRGAIASLKGLNPRPAAGFASTGNHYVTPDVLVERDEEGNYVLKLTDDRQPKIFLNRRYMEMLKNGKATEEEKVYMRKNLNSAMLLLNSIDQRKSTLERVSRAIVDRQKEFLDKGAEHIVPLKMQEIADQVGVHVTTISRAAADKWMQTPRGTFPIKRFFGGGTTNTITGEDVAYEKVKRKLAEFIGAEDKSKPLSDEDLVKKFEAEGLDVARRTVTKYRKLTNIPSSRERKAH